MIKRFENYLIQSKEFRLPEISDIKNEDVLIVDSTEIDIQRPKKSPVKRIHYSGKKKKHKIKSQILISSKSKKRFDIRVDHGSIHDFKLFKETYNSLGILEDTLIIGDSGYQGIERINVNSLIYSISLIFRIHLIHSFS